VEVVLAASVVSALAALGAVWFAYQAVLETRRLRREDRLAHLPELVVEAGEGALELVSQYGRPEWRYPIASGRLRAALALVDDPLPACWKLTEAAAHMRLDGTGSGDEARALTTAALAELEEAAGNS
jgi:hypothetical protein